MIVTAGLVCSAVVGNFFVKGNRERSKAAKAEEVVTMLGQLKSSVESNRHPIPYGTTVKENAGYVLQKLAKTVLKERDKMSDQQCVTIITAVRDFMEILRNSRVDLLEKSNLESTVDEVYKGIKFSVGVVSEQLASLLRLSLLESFKEIRQIEFNKCQSICEKLEALLGEVRLSGLSSEDEAGKGVALSTNLVVSKTVGECEDRRLPQRRYPTPYGTTAGDNAGYLYEELRIMLDQHEDVQNKQSMIDALWAFRQYLRENKRVDLLEKGNLEEPFEKAYEEFSSLNEGLAFTLQSWRALLEPALVRTCAKIRQHELRRRRIMLGKLDSVE